MLRLINSCLALVLVLAVPASSSAADAKVYTKPSKAQLRQKLTKEQFSVTQENDTEEPFQNAYWNNHQDGIYVDIVSGEPLFSSKEKYDSGTGWPSFWQPLVKENVVEKIDFSLILGTRTEVRSKGADSHLGHVFKDGPPPTGLRYCINSAALRFIPASKLEESGYGNWAYLFRKIAAGQKESAVPSLPGQQNNAGTPTAISKIETVVFAGGCFWGVQAVFKHVNGVVDAVSGYAGGKVKNPSYEQVSEGNTGHAESVKVSYDTSKVTLSTLLKVFFDVAHDPTELNRQGPDVGTQYRSAIFYSNEEQKQVIETYIGSLKTSKKYTRPIVTQVAKIDTFYPAETYHQNYAEIHPNEPYIVMYDKPKIEKLRKEFPQLWNDKKN